MASTSPDLLRSWRGKLVDVDVHAAAPTLETIWPYLSEVWRQHIFDRHWTGPSSAYTYPPRLRKTARPEWRPRDGSAAGATVDLLRQHILDPLSVKHAVVNCVYPIDFGHPDFSAGLAQAANDWLVKEWLDADDRLRASIVLPSRDPAAMVAEIDRVGRHPGFVQALLPVRSGRLYGNRIYHPVFEALVRHDLVAGVHWGGSNDGLPTTSSGWPSWYTEEYVTELQVFEGQLTSMVGEGVFQAFPSLRVAFLECGFTWVPMWAWNLDRVWKGTRREVPWLDRRPFEIIREQVRFSVAPLDADSAPELAKIVSWLGSDDLLMFATDYPHLHDDDLSILLDGLSEPARQKLMHANAATWYRLEPGLEQSGIPNGQTES